MIRQNRAKALKFDRILILLIVLFSSAVFGQNTLTFPSMNTPFSENGHTFTVSGVGYLWNADYRSAPYCAVSNSTNGNIIITKTVGPNPFQLNNLWLKGQSWATMEIIGYNGSTQLYSSGTFNPSDSYRQETFTNWTGINKIEIKVYGNGYFSVDDISYTVENVAPSNISLSNNIIGDGSASGTLVGVLSTTDSEDTGPHTYSFAAGGVDNASFQISGDELRTNFTADYSLQSEYNIKIRTTDSGSLYFEKDLAVSIQPSGIVWNGPTITFTKNDYADCTLEENQDRLTDQTWITRDDYEGLFNAYSESFFNYVDSPTNTEWAYGTTADYLSLTYQPWIDWHGWNPPGTVGQDAVLHLINENIYIDIKFISWTEGGAGGGFSYQRSTPPVVEPDPILWTGPTITFTKNDYADWTLPENQDRLTDSTWIARKDIQGLFNAYSDSGYDTYTPSNTEWSYGTIAGYDTLTYQPWVNWAENNPAGTIGRNAVLHLIDENIFIDIKFTSYTGGASGGGFSYERSTPEGYQYTIPENVSVSSDSLNVNINWDAVWGAAGYNIYTSSDPYGTYTIHDYTVNNYYSEPFDQNMVFYYIKAVYSQEVKK